MTAALKLYNEESIQDIADAIRGKNGSSETYKVSEMAQAITDIPTGGGGGSEGWVRPADWPDYSLIDISNDEVIYMTYDTKYDPAFASFKFTGAFTVEIGTLTNGVFTARETVNVASNTYWTKLLTDYTGYVVIRVRPNGGHLTAAQITYDHDGTDAGQTFWSVVQPVVEMYGRLPYIANMNYFARNSRHLKSVILTGLASATSLERFAGDAIVIENIDLSGIPSTSKPSIYMAFTNCRRLKHLHLHGMGASLSTNAFQNCYKLQDTDLEDLKMDTAGVASLFSNCYSLPSGLDLSGWKVNATACGNLFFWCAFQDINITGWNLSGNFSNMFNTCSLRKIPNANYGVITNIGSLFTDALIEGVLDLRTFNFGTITQLQGISYMPLVTEIYIPANFTTIASNCMRDNFSMKAVHFESTTPPSLPNTSAILYNNKRLQKIYVPYSADHSVLNAYLNATNWSALSAYLEEEPQ